MGAIAKAVDWIMGTRVARWVAVALAVIVAWVGYGYKKHRQGKREGLDEAEALQREKKLKDMEVRRDVEGIVRRSGDGTAADELRKHWGRD